MRRVALLALGLPVTLLGAGPASTNTAAPPRPPMVWRSGVDRHDAAIEGWPLDKVLNRLSRQTGWRVLVEPGTRTTVRTRFTGLPARQALPLLVGGLDFTLTSGGDGSTTLRVFRSQATSAKEKPPGEHADELILRPRKDGAGTAVDHARALGGKVTGTNGAALRLKFDSASQAEAARKALEADESVASVETNLDLFPPETPVPVDASGLPAPGIQPTVRPDGTQRVVALVDSAVQPLSAEYQAFLLPSVEIVPGAVAGADPTHGTAMAEAMVRGLAAASPDGQSTTRIRGYDVYGANDSTSTWDVAVAVTRAVQDGATIVNLSLGGSEESPYLRDVLTSVTQQGALVVAAAGNDGGTGLFYPAAYDSALAVTASTSSGTLANYANHGGFVDVAAPGSTLVTLPGGAWRVQGTSVSAAYVSGVAGALGQDPAASLSGVRQTLGNAFPVPSVSRTP